MSFKRFLVAWEPTEIRRNGNRVEVVKGGRKTQVPVRYIEALVVFGSSSVSSQGVNLLLSGGVPVYFLSRFGSLKGALVPMVISSRTRMRLRQFKAFELSRVEVAREIVMGKLSAMERLFRLELPELKSSLRKAVSVDEVMGIEGTASRLMFERFSQNIEGCGLDFGGRSYRPPKDRINALLSLSYTFLYCLAFPLVVVAGYDPYLSFLHTKRGTHASFCSDVIEPVRVFITKELERPLIRGVFGKRDFRREGEGFYLKADSLPKLMGWFEEIKDRVVEEIKKNIVAVGEVF